jgi:phosphomannomutase
MSSFSLPFDTDGWHAVPDETFTDENVIRIAHAFARYHTALSEPRQHTIAVAYDGRRSSRQHASLVAAVLSSYGIRVLLSNAMIPTPVLSFAVRQRSCSAGVMITAGPLPPRCNGIKFKAAGGRPFLPEETTKVEAQLPPPAEQYTPRPSEIELTDFLPAYIGQLRTLVDFALLQTFGEDPRNHAAVIIDSMGGAGQTILEDLLAPCGWRAQTIFGTAAPDFYDRVPEPVPHNLEPLTYNVSVTDTLFGIATDGDAGRCAVVYDDGECVTAQETILALAWHLRENKKWPVGYQPHVPDQDGILSALFFAEMIAMSGKPLREIIGALHTRVGPVH